jgi:hypothetical protein
VHNSAENSMLLSTYTLKGGFFYLYKKNNQVRRIIKRAEKYRKKEIIHVVAK